MKDLNQLKARYMVLQAKIEDEFAGKEPPAELQMDLQNAIQDYQTAKAESEAEKQKQFTNKGEMKTMNKREMQNKIMRAMLKGQAFTDEMKNSGLPLPQLMDEVAAKGNLEAVPARGGYLVPEEFLAVDEFGGEVIRIPATDIAISEPTGKAPYFDKEQAKEAGAYLKPVEELKEITEVHPVYGQLDYTAVDKYAITPISTKLIEDTSFDVVAAAGEIFGIAGACQRNLDILAAVKGISNIATEYAGTGKTFANIEGAKAIQKAILSLKGVNRKNATIVVSSDVWAKLATLTDKNDNPLLMRDMNNAAIYRLYGVPVLEMEDAADATCLVGNFARVSYFVRKALEISIDYSAGFTRNAVLVKAGMRGCALVREPRAFVAVAEGAKG